jgi:PAS domain S-box-containing protein
MGCDKPFILYNFYEQGECAACQNQTAAALSQRQTRQLIGGHLLQAIGFFSSILLTCGLTGGLALYAWRRRRSVPGARSYAGLALGECLLALAEMLSMLSPGQAQALFWFNVRIIFTAAIPVIWLVFALEYSQRKDWLSNRLVIVALIIPLFTLIMVWSNGLHGLWVTQEVSFQQSGSFWLAETSARIPGIWFLIHSLYSMFLLLAGIVVLLANSWNKPGLFKGQAILLSGGALLVLGTSIIPAFNLIPQDTFNPFIPGIGASALVSAFAMLRFQFLRRAPETISPPPFSTQKAQENFSMAVNILIFLILVAGISSIGYLSYKNYESQFRTQVEYQLSAIATLKISGLVDWRAERLGDGEIIRNNPAFAALVQRALGNPAEPLAREQLQTWLDSLRSYYRYERVILANVDGLEQAASPAGPDLSANPQPAEVLPALNSGEVVFQDFHPRTSDGSIHLSILAPIYVPQELNRPLGVLVLEINPQTFLYPYLSKWPTLSDTAETLLVRRDGADVLFLNPLRFQADSALRLRFPLATSNTLAAKAVLGQTGIVEGVDYRGQAVIGDLRPIPGSPWFLISRMDLAEIYAPLNERVGQTVVLFGALILTAGTGLTLLGRRQQMRAFRARLQAAEALRVSEENFRNVFEHASVGKSITAIGGKINTNQAFRQMIGYSEEECSNLNWQAITFPADIENDQRIINSLIAGERAAACWIKRYIHKDGKIIWAEISTAIQRDPAGSPLYFITTITDITERKQQEAQILAAQVELQKMLAEADQLRTSLLRVVEDQKMAEEEIRRLNAGLEDRVASRTAQLEASNKELEAFAYSISHDLRAPLRAIDGFSRILEQEYTLRLDEEGHRLVSVIRKNTNTMDHLITDLLALARVGSIEIRHAPIEMTALVNSIYQELASPTVLKKIVFKVSNLPNARGDPTLIGVVWSNLISNAIKFTTPKEEGIIEICGSKTDGICTYWIKDNGVGFNSKFANKLFGVFQRLHKVGEFEGTGVGLAIVQSIIHRHGGQVWGEGQIGAGATFYFTIPERQIDHA